MPGMVNGSQLINPPSFCFPTVFGGCVVMASIKPDRFVQRERQICETSCGHGVDKKCLDEVE